MNRKLGLWPRRALSALLEQQLQRCRGAETCCSNQFHYATAIELEGVSALCRGGLRLIEHALFSRI